MSYLWAKDQSEMKALILSGGNVKAAFQAGVLSILLKDNDYDIIAGISGGAVNGCAIATGRWEEAFKLWQTVDEKDIVYRRTVPKIIWRLILSRLGGRRKLRGFTSITPLEETLYELLRHRRLEKMFIAGRVDMLTGQYHGLMDEKSPVPNIIGAVIGSSAVPIMMDPQDFDGTLWLDGGIHNITPIKEVITRWGKKISDITIVTTQPVDKPPPAIKKKKRDIDLIDINQYTISYLLDMAFARDLKHFIDRNNLIEQTGAADISLKDSSGRELLYIPYQLIEPPYYLGKGDNYSRENINRLLQLGIDTMMNLKAKKK